MKNIKFTIKNIDKQFEVPLRNVETGQNFLDQLTNYWNLVNPEIKLHVNNGIAINPNNVVIRNDSKLQVEIIQAKIKIAMLKTGQVLFYFDLMENFGNLKKYIKDEIFSYPDEVDMFLFCGDQQQYDESHIFDIVLNPCITLQLMTTIQFRSESGIIKKYIDINDMVKNIITELQKNYNNKKIDLLKYHELIMLPKDRPIEYNIKPYHIIDVFFEETQPEYLKLKFEYRDDNQTYKLRLTSTMEDLVKQIIIDFFENVTNTKIKLKLNGTELPLTGYVKNVIGMRNEAIKIEKVSEGDKIIQILLLKRGQTAIKTLKQIKVSDKVSTLNENFQQQIMNFYYNNKLLQKEKSFDIQGIKQNEVEIEFEEIEGEDEEILFIDANTQKQTHKTVNIRKNLHDLICEQIGQDTEDYWVCIDCLSIIDTKKPLCEIQMKEKVIVYCSLDMMLKVKYDGITYNINVNRELCVIDLFKVFKEKFKIPDDKQFLIRHNEGKTIKDIVHYQLWGKKDCEFELYVKDIEEPKSELIQQQYIVKVEILHLSTTIDYIVTVTDPICAFLIKFSEFLNLPRNQPCELQNEGKTYSNQEKIQIFDLNLNQNFIYIIKDEMILQFENKLNGEEHFETLKFNQPFKQIKQNSKLFQQNDYIFYTKSKPIEIEKQLRDLEIQELDLIEYEIITNNQEQSKQQQQLQQNADNNNFIQINEIQNLNQESNQDLQINQQSNELNQQYPIPEIHPEVNNTNQNNTILYKYLNQEFEMNIVENTKVKELKQKIIDFQQCSIEIDLRQDGVILDNESVITQYKSIFLVIPKSIKIIIKSKTKNYEQQFQLNVKIQELYDRMNNFYKFKFDLVFNDKILDPQLSFSQVGMTNNSVVFMKY